MKQRRAVLVTLAVTLAVVLAIEPALAQAKNPFSVGISEGGGSTTGIMGWILSQQGFFERSLAAAVRASKADGSALWWLGALSFVYGVLHAAGPGHGKAVLAAYMVANERALRRGIVLSFLAALLQALVAIALVGVLSLVFHATAIGMRQGAAVIEKLSYLGVALLGLWLVWQKGASLVEAWHGRSRREVVFTRADSRSRFAFAGSARGLDEADRRGPVLALRGRTTRGRFTCVAADADATTAHVHGPNCGHAHMPDPATLGEDFSWRESISTVVAAGARPCSGAILVLVFALAQGIFPAGIAATLIMALGTAITTAGLAAIAVLAKSIASRLAGPETGRGVLVARGLEVAAAALVLAVGLSLLFGVGPLQALA